MKIQITGNLVKITPPPKRNKKKGLKIYFWRNPAGLKKDMPIATADIKKGEGKYDLSSLEGFEFSLKSIEF